MTKKALLLVAACIVVVPAACAQPKEKVAQPRGQGYQEPVSADRCTESPCKLDLFVEESHGECKVKVKPEVLLVNKLNDARIEWKLTTPGYKIVSITFKDEDKKWREEYRHRVATPSNKQFHDKHVRDQDADVTDKNSEDGSWLYKVVVKKGDRTCTLDPPIINEM